jgi:hypothetical protein
LFGDATAANVGAMAELRRNRSARPTRNAKVRVAALAGTQKGRITRAQLRALGVANPTVTDWASAAYLHQELPGVYAVGHPGRSEESDLFSAVLYAGPGAALTGVTAGLWRGLVKWRTQDAIEVSTSRRCRSLAADDELNRLRREIVVRDRRDVGRAIYRGIPTVSREQVVLDIAASTDDLQLVRFVLAQLDFMRCLNVPALQRLRGRGIPGSTLLGEAIATHQPLLARARSRFEIKLIYVCEVTGIPLPEVNVKIGEITPDAVWRDQMVVVGCDGEGNHGTWAQRKRDLNEDRVLRGLHYFPIRYTYEQLDDPWAIHADLMPVLEERRGRAALMRAA